MMAVGSLGATALGWRALAMMQEADPEAGVWCGEERSEKTAVDRLAEVLREGESTHD